MNKIKISAPSARRKHWDIWSKSFKSTEGYIRNLTPPARLKTFENFGSKDEKCKPLSFRTYGAEEVGPSAGKCNMCRSRLDPRLRQRALLALRRQNPTGHNLKFSRRRGFFSPNIIHLRKFA